MVDHGPLLVTGAAGQLGAVGRTVTGLLLHSGIPVRAMVRREDDRSAALRKAGAEIVIGDLLEPSDVYRVVSGCRRVYFGMSRFSRVLGSDCHHGHRRPGTSRRGLSQHVPDDGLPDEYPKYDHKPSAAAALAQRASAHLVGPAGRDD